MNAIPGAESRRPSAAGVRTLGPLVMLAYPVLGLLAQFAYPVWAAESLTLLLGAALLGGAVMALAAASRLLLANTLLAVVALGVLTAQLNLLGEGLLLAGAVLAAAAGLLRRRFAELLAVLFIALIVGSLLDSYRDHRARTAPAAPVAVDTALPPVVHLVMDGYIGPDGLPHRVAAQRLRDALLAFFDSYGFELHPRAYSHYHATEDSLTRAFNFRNDDQNLFQEKFLLHRDLTVRENAYFDRLREAGYAINVYQSGAVDFCRSARRPVDRCWSHPLPDASSLRAPGAATYPQRLEALFKLLVLRSDLLEEIATQLKLDARWGIAAFDLSLLDAMAADMAAGARGRAFVAHLLLPHAPFVFDSDCTLDYASESWTRFESFRGEFENTPETRGPRYLAYLEQAGCGLRVLDRLFGAMKRIGIFEESIIVVHGDHGSRIYLYSPLVQNLDRVDGIDLRDAFSVLFAVKWPGGTAEQPGETVPLEALMERVITRIEGGTPVPDPTPPFIYFSGTFPLYRVDMDIFETNTIPESARSMRPAEGAVVDDPPPRD